MLILPVVLCVAFSAVAAADDGRQLLGAGHLRPRRRVFVGTEWFAAVMRDDDLHGALLRQLVFSLAVLLIEIPLGIALALAMPAHGLEGVGWCWCSSRCRC